MNNERIEFFDSHTHVQFAAYDDDRNEVIQRALDSGVGMINVGTNKKTSEDAVELAKKYDKLWAAVGVHPNHTYDTGYADKKEVSEDAGVSDGFDYEHFRNLAKEPEVVAIGECGFDYFRLGDKDEKRQNDIKRKQEKALKKQIELAKKVNLPLMVHCRPSPGTQDAYEYFYKVAEPYIDDLAGIVIHFFVGNMKTAEKFLRLGAYFTFGGVVTFARDYDTVIKEIPLDRILLETDAPYVTPAPHRGKRNEPTFVVEVYKKMAELKGVDLEKLRAQSLQNNRDIFS